MSKQTEVADGLKALVQGALPGALVLVLANGDSAPATIPATGRVILRLGDPGVPETTLSPVTYTYEHDFPLEIAVAKSGALTAPQVLDIMLSAVADAILADRQLGGLADWVDATAPVLDDVFTAGADAACGTAAAITVTYSTTRPL